MFALASSRALLALAVAAAPLLAHADEPAEAPEAADAAPSTAAASPSAASPTATTSAADEPALDPFSAWRLRLASAVDLTNEDPAAGVDGLAAALAEAPRFTTELAGDAAARSDRNSALLALARGYLVQGDAERAAGAVFEAFVGAGADPLPVDRFGPSLADFVGQQRRALDSAGKAAITVECAVPCRVYLNERPSPAAAQGLALGTYRLYVEASTGAAAPLQEPVTLASAGETTRVVFPAGSGAPEGPADDKAALAGKDDGKGKRARRSTRTLPRWLEITAIVGGAAAIGAGTALLLIDGKCSGDTSVTPTAENPGDPATCAEIFDTRIGAYTAIGVGAFALLGGVVTLSVDASRARQAKREAGPQAVMVGFTRRF